MENLYAQDSDFEDEFQDELDEDWEGDYGDSNINYDDDDYMVDNEYEDEEY